MRPFARSAPRDVDYAGGKGANLGELTSAGLPVPDGFVVGAPAYAAFCAQTGLRERLAEAARRRRRGGHRRTAGRQRSRARAVRSDPVARGAVAHEISAAYEQLADEDPADAGRRALLGHGRGHRRDLLRRDERDVPEHPRRRRGDRRRAPLLALAVRRAHDLLPRRQRLRPGRHGHRGRRTASGQLDARRRDVHRQPRHRRARRARDRGLLRPRRGGRLRLGLARPLRRGEGHAGDPPPRGSPQGPRRSSTPPTAAPASAPSPRRRRCGPVLSDEEVLAVAELGRRIEEHYGFPQDTEWAFDPDGKLWMLQSRPITTLHDAPVRTEASRWHSPRSRSRCCCAGWAEHRAAPAAPRACSSRSRTPPALNDGDVLVTHMTSPDWLPLMRRAAAIVTDSGGMTCHAAIVSRELGIPCVVGTGEATRKLRDGEIVTVDATRGVVLRGRPPTRAGVSPSPRRRRVSRAAQRRRRLGNGPGDRHADPRQPLRALAGGAGQGSAGRRRGSAACGDDGARGAGGRSSAHAARGGTRRGVRRAHGRGAEHVRGGLRAATGHLPHDRLPHERVLRAARRRALRAARVQPDDRLPRRAALHARARRVRARAGGAAPGLGRGTAQPARDAAVRAHHTRAAPLPRADRRVGSARPSGLRAVGDGRGALGAVQPRATTPRSASPASRSAPTTSRSCCSAQTATTRCWPRPSTSAIRRSPPTCAS